MTAPAFATARPWPALWSLVIGFFMILVDSTIVSIATPALMRGLNAGISAVVWVTSAYLLAYAVPLLITGRLGDRYGPKRVYLVGLTVFTFASAACGLSDTIEMLIAARAVQGLGASMMTPQTMAVITRIFPPDKRGPAMGLWGAVAGVASLVGPVLGGVLIDTLGWEWIFFINLPVGVIGFIAVVRNVPSLERHHHRFDWLGVALNVVGMFLIVFAIQEGQTYDWGTIVGPVSVWSLIIVGAVVLAFFAVFQSRAAEPLVPPGLFRDRNFSVANGAILVMGFLITSMMFPMTLFAQTARGLTPTQAALLSLPLAVITGGLAPVIGKLIDRGDPKWFAVAGFSLMVASLVVYAWFMRPGISILWLLIPSGMLGAANACIWGPLSVSATRNLPMHRAGAGAGVYNTTRQIGAVLGSAAVAAFMEARLSAQLGAGGGSGMAMMGTRIPAPLEQGFSTAMSQSMLLPAGVAVLGVFACLLLVPPQGPSAARVDAGRPRGIEPQPPTDPIQQEG
ncbi:DHA2 family efflux MFS transporter permease subunit [Granulicoccus sp. GXG6511]|uniref:DHA2 family efflux MFS transporter permease subunit n=1 Tax=Granulicoccus sp. GXG6511 TaxID=3381351 RepID=UPI003D7EC210